MSGQTNIDEPPFVLQNCSAMSRQAASSTPCQKPKRGWGLGWLRGGNNGNDDNKNNNQNITISPKGEEQQEAAEGSETGSDSTVSTPQILKSESPPPIPSPVTPSSSDAQPTSPAKTAIHPPSPKSLSPRHSKPAVRSNIYNGNKTNSSEYESKQQLPSRQSYERPSHDSGVGDGGAYPEKLSRQKRREEVRAKTAWYEEYIRDQVASDGGGLTSLHKDEVVALGLFDKQRRCARRIRLFGRQETDDEMDLTDDELEQLLDLADRCKQAQIDEAEMEMLLLEMENGHAVDMDRLYHLELRSRKRVGEILNEEELDALQALDEKERDKDAFAELSQKKSLDGGIDGDDAARLDELTLLQRKRNGNGSLTPDQLEAAEIIEMRREDARIDERDYKKLLRLKQQGHDIDEDRFSLLSLIDRQRRGSELVEAETEILEQYFELREEEYLERLESTVASSKNDNHKATSDGGAQILRDFKPEEETETDVEHQWPDEAADDELRKEETETDMKNQRPDEAVEDEDPIDEKRDDPEAPIGKKLDKSLDWKERGDEATENQLHQIESVPQKRDGDITVTDASTEKKDVKVKDDKLEAEENNDTRSTLTFDEMDLSRSEREALEEFRERLKKHGLPLAVSFPPIAKDASLEMSDVSFSDETYIKDLLTQQENRASERKEECLEESYKIYKRVSKKQRLPESEERLLMTFAKVLKQRNKEMREADEAFDKLVERELALHEQRKQEATDAEITEDEFENGGGNQSASKKKEEASKNNIDMRSKNERNAEATIGGDKKHNTMIGEKSPTTVSDGTNTNQKEPPPTKQQGWGVVGFFRRNSGDTTNGEEISQAKESEMSDKKLQSSEEAIKARIKPTESIRGKSEQEEKATTQVVESARSSLKSQGEHKSEIQFSDRRKNSVSKVEPVQDDNAQNLEDENVEKRLNDDRQTKEIGKDELIHNTAEAKTGLDFLRFGTRGEGNISLAEETVESEVTIPQSIAAKEVRLKGHARSPMIPILSDHSTSMENAAQWDALHASEIADNEMLANHGEHKKHELGSDFDGQSRRKDSEETRAIRLNDSSDLQNSPTDSSVSISSVEDNLKEKDNSSRLRRRSSNIERKRGTKDLPQAEESNSEVDQYVSSSEFKSYIQELDASESTPKGGIDHNRNFGDNGKKPGGVSTSDFENDLLYELELLHRLKRGIPLTERRERELDLLIFIRGGGTLSLRQLKEFKRHKRDRQRISRHLAELYAQRTGSKPFKDNLLYEVELFHKALGDEPLSDNEQIEIGIFERRMDGQVLREIDLKMLETLKNERLNVVPEGSSDVKSVPIQTDHHPGVGKEPSVSTSLIPRPTDHHSMDETKESISEGLSPPVVQPISRRSNHRLHRPISNTSNHRIDQSISGKSNHRVYRSISDMSNHRVDQSISRSSNHRVHRSISDRSNHRVDQSLVETTNNRPFGRFERMMSQRTMVSQRSMMSRRPSLLLPNQRSVRKLERMISRRSSRLLVDPQSMIDDDDSVYRRELLERQKAGKRLDKEEFRWLQILMKKFRKEELDKDDLDELENMRSQRNEKDVYHVNTKKLIEEEIKRKQKKKAKEQRRKEKEERRKQRREERKQRKKNERMKRRGAGPSKIELQKSIQSTSDESSHTRQEVQIIGTPKIFEENKKDEPEKGLFGGVFGKSAQKRRQEQQLEEAKRLQAELIKAQMKALALDNEAEELEREKVMQQQLVEETIEKKRADSVDGSSSWYASSDDDFWFGDSDSSSWSSSWDSSSSVEISSSEEMDRTPKNSERTRDSDNLDVAVKPAGLPNSVVNDVIKEQSDVGSDLDVSLRINALSKNTTHSRDTENDASDHQGSQGSFKFKRKGSGEFRDRSRSRRGGRALGSHIKKRKKKRTKDGDEMSLGTLQLSKASKESSKGALGKTASQHSTNKEEKAKCRPWVVDDQNDAPEKCAHPDAAQNGGKGCKEEGISDESLEFHRSFVSTISQADEENENDEENDGADGEAEDKDNTEKSFFSDSEQPVDDNTENANSTGTAEHPLIDSFTSLGEEAYDLGLQEYENMESRLDEHKQAEFDLTWDTTFADENVIAQINQRLRERQRAMEAKREKKKEKKERKKSKVVPRLFLFEGEKVAKNGKKRKKKNMSKKKLDRTLTREFRKAMEEIFDHNSDSDGEYLIGQEEEELNEDDEEDDNDILPFHLSSSRESYDDDDSDPLSYSENDPNRSASFEADDDDDGNFDGEYLKRLQERSMPSEVKKMLSGRIAPTSKRHMASRRDLAKNENRKGVRRPRRKKNGEIVNNDIDPSEVYLQELEKQKKGKDFTISGLRKELEEAKRTSFKDFVREHNEQFGNFDHLASVPLHQTKVVQSKPKKVSLGKGPESLQRHRSGRSMSMASLGTASLGTTHSDEVLLTGNRKTRRSRPLGGTVNEMPEILEDDRGEDSGRSRSGKSGKSGNMLISTGEYSNDMDIKSGSTGVNAKLPNLFGVGGGIKAIKRKFKPKKQTAQSGGDDSSGGGGGLLQGSGDGAFDEASLSRRSGGIDLASLPSAFGRDQEPLPLPPDTDDEDARGGGGGLKDTMNNVKGVLSKVKKLPKKLPGKNLIHRKGSIMMNDDG